MTTTAGGEPAVERTALDPLAAPTDNDVEPVDEPDCTDDATDDATDDPTDEATAGESAEDR